MKASPRERQRGTRASGIGHLRQDSVTTTCALTGPAPEYSICLTPAAGAVLVHVVESVTGPSARVHTAPPTFTCTPLATPAGAPPAGLKVTLMVTVMGTGLAGLAGVSVNVWSSVFSVLAAAVPLVPGVAPVGVVGVPPFVPLLAAQPAARIDRTTRRRMERMPLSSARGLMKKSA